LKFILILLLSISSIELQAQNNCNYIISGKLSSIQINNESPSGVEVLLVQSSQGTFSDANGNFRITAVCGGTYTLHVHGIGFKTLDTIISISANTIFNYQLETDIRAIKNILIESQEIKKQNITTIVKDQLTELQVIQSRGLSLSQSLQQITGVSSIQSGSSISKPVIHGLHSNRILILNNGIRQEGQQWGSEHAPEIDPFIATKFSVIKGAASIRYGSDAIGGVIIIEPKEFLKKDGIVGEINIAGASNGKSGTASAMLEGMKKFKEFKINARVQGTKKVSGNLQTPKYYLDNTAYNEINYSGAISLTHKKKGIDLYYSQFNTKIGIFTGSHVGSISDLYNLINASEPNIKSEFSYDINRAFQEVKHDLLKINFYASNIKYGKINFIFARQLDIRKEYDADISFNDSLARLNLPDLYFQLTTHTADLVWEQPSWFKYFYTSIGFNFITQGNVFKGSGYRSLIPNFRNYTGGVFLLGKYIKHNSSFEFGVRYDYKWMKIFMLNPNSLKVETPTYNWKNATYSIGYTNTLNKKLSIYMNASSAWRAPQVIELFAKGIHQSAASYEIGNDDLKIEQALNIGCSMKYSFKKWDAELGLYNTYFPNYIFLKADSIPKVTIQGAFPSFYYTETEANFTGIDLSVKYQIITHIKIVSKASVIRARNISIKNWLVNIPSNKYEASITYNAQKFFMMRDINASFSYSYTAIQNHVPPKSDYLVPPPAYSLCNIDISSNLPLKKFNVNTTLSISNIFNVAYRDYLNRFRYFADEIGRNISIKLNIPFEFLKK
jgi:iron complex outermembrane receptor protein